MYDHKDADKQLRCATCEDTFVFTTGEQELFRLRGITSDPLHCPNCSRGRVLATTRLTSSNRAPT